MKLSRLVIREIKHRKLNFALSVVGVVLAVVCVLGTLGLLRANDVHTDEVIEGMEKASAACASRSIILCAIIKAQTCIICGEIN